MKRGHFAAQTTLSGWAIVASVVGLLACGGDETAGSTAAPGGSASSGGGFGAQGGTASQGGAGTGGSAAGGAGASGILPPERVVDWEPGVPGGIPAVETVCPAGAPSVLDFGALGNGTTDDYAAFAAAVSAAAEGSAVRIPAGSYLLESGLVLDKGVVLCGEGANDSRLIFDGDAPGIQVVTYDRGDYVSVTGGLGKGSTALEVADSSSFVVGEGAEVVQANDWSKMDPEGVWQNDPWAPADSVGQMVEVVAIDGNVLTIDPPLTIAIDPGFDPRARRVGLVRGAGIQGLFLQRLATYDQPTIILKNTLGAWVRDCESQDTSTIHVGVESSLRCEVRHSTFHHAYDYGGGGHGYGVGLHGHTTSCLVEDNVFFHLRHAMMVQTGATGNVFGYNFSTDPLSDGDWSPCDISLHGHYASMNLFEGNTVAEVDVSDYWGPSGPGNTLFRTRVTAEGIDVLDYSHGQNVVGNELGNDPNLLVIDETVQSTLAHGNWLNDAIEWDPAIVQHELPASLYLSSKPAFFGDTAWPATGADLVPNGSPLPAEQRFLSR